MELFQLRCFLAVAETENISQAARNIYMSQSALSKVISRFEKEVGTPLFIRSKSRIHLNANGLMLQKYVSESIQLLDEGLQLVGRLTAASIPLHIGYNGPRTISDITEACQALLPALQLEAESLSLREIRERLSHGKLDIGVLCTEEKLPSASFSGIAKQRWLAAVTETHPCYGADCITPEHIAQEIACTFGDEDDIRFVEAQFSQNGMKPKVFIKSAGDKEVARLINQGSAIGIMEEDAFFHRMQSAPHLSLRAIPLAGDWQRTIYIAARNGAPPETAQAVSLLTSLLQAERAEIDRFLSPAF